MSSTLIGPGEALLGLDAEQADDRDRSWIVDAACHGINTDLFYPEQDCDPYDVARVKELCRACPVRVECLDYGLHDDHGIWGGLSRDERVYIRTGGRRLVIMTKALREFLMTDEGREYVGSKKLPPRVDRVTTTVGGARV